MQDRSPWIRQTVKEYILREALPGEGSESLHDDTPLITGGILDSIKITKLVIFLEDAHGIEFQAHEMTTDSLDTVERIARIVQMKIQRKG